jgi:hypothetical protein
MEANRSQTTYSSSAVLLFLIVFLRLPLVSFTVSLGLFLVLYFQPPLLVVFGSLISM